MSEVVWVSAARNDSSVGRRLEFAQLETDEKEKFLSDMRRQEQGEPLSQDAFPQVLFESSDSSAAPYSNHLGDFFLAGYCIVSDKMAGLLKQFDLGEGSLYPIEAILQRNRTTELPGKYFFFNFGSKKTCFDPESTDAKVSQRITKALPLWMLFVNDAADDDIAVSQTALGGADFWIDPTTPQQFYLSDRLVVALKDAGLDKALKLKRCRVV